MTTIDNGAFYSCVALDSVTLGSSVSTIGAGAFEGCSGLSCITLPRSITSIGYDAFSYCDSLSRVDYLGAIADWCGISFSQSSSNPLRHAHHFYVNNAEVTQLVIPDSVTSIGNNTFFGGSGFTSLSLGDSLTSIGDNAFSGYSAITHITFPQSLTTIGESAFEDCVGLTGITSLCETAPTLGYDAFSGVSSTILVHIPCGHSMSYYSRWNYFSNFIEGSGFTFTATFSDSTRGTVQTLVSPTCASPTAVVYAQANTGYHFDQWSDSNTSNPRTYLLTSNTHITATFVPDVITRDAVIVTHYDTIYLQVHDTTSLTLHDTIYLPQYIYDTIYQQVHDTAYIIIYLHDTTTITFYDTTFITLHDTTYLQIHDTPYRELTYYELSVMSGNMARGVVAGSGTFPDSTWVEMAAIPIEGNMFVQWNDGNTDNPRRIRLLGMDATLVATFEAASQSVTDVSPTDYSVTTNGSQIILTGAANQRVHLFDSLGRLISTTQNAEEVRIFNMPTTGVYLLQVANHPAHRVVVVK